MDLIVVQNLLDSGAVCKLVFRGVKCLFVDVVKSRRILPFTFFSIFKHGRSQKLSMLFLLWNDFLSTLICFSCFNTLFGKMMKKNYISLVLLRVLIRLLRRFQTQLPILLICTITKTTPMSMYSIRIQLFVYKKLFSIKAENSLLILSLLNNWVYFAFFTN